MRRTFRPSRPRRSRVAPLLVLTLALSVGAALLSSCTTSSSDSLVVYSGRTENLIDPILQQFKDETGISIDVKYGQSADLALQISAEGRNTPADVFISQNPGTMVFLTTEGLLAALEVETLDLTDEAFQGTNGEWVGLSGRQRVLVYNSGLVDVDTLPSSVYDLTDEEFKGDVAVAPANGSFQDFVTAMRADIGDEGTKAWLGDMGANDAQTYANNTAIVEAVSRGEVPMGLVNHYYNFRELEENPDSPTLNHYFDGDDIGSLVIVSAGAVLEPSDQKAKANQLLQFLLGEQAQTFFSEETFEYPLAAGVEGVAEGLPPLPASQSIDLSELEGGLEGTLVLIDESGLQS